TTTPASGFIGPSQRADRIRPSSIDTRDRDWGKVLKMRTSTSGSQALRGFKKAAVFGAIGVAAVAVAFRATGPDGAIIAALMLTFRYCGKPVMLPPCFILI